MDYNTKALIIAFYEQYKSGKRDDYYKYFDLMPKLKSGGFWVDGEDNWVIETKRFPDVSRA